LQQPFLVFWYDDLDLFQTIKINFQKHVFEPF